MWREERDRDRQKERRTKHLSIEVLATGELNGLILHSKTGEYKLRNWKECPFYEICFFVWSVYPGQLVKIRQAIAKAQEENNQMDIRIGVLQHILLRYTLKTHKRFDADNGDKFLVY